MTNTFGYTGKILRVDLTTGKIWTDDTMKYKDFIGGEGMSMKIMWDEVPAGTHPFSPENKIIFGSGPLCGTGVPCSGRTNITSLLPSNPDHSVSSSHMGGYFSVEMKYAGWDLIVVEGKSAKPVWLRIEDDKVWLEDGRWVWGKGMFDAMAMISSQMGKEAQIAMIGPAGENQLNLSVIRTGASHSAGGHGGVMGSKNLKAIAIKGTGSVKVAARPEELMALDKYMMTIIGANNQHVVPRFPHPWAEYTASGSRWTAKKGLYWGAANPPVETGECYPEDMQSVGLRTHKGFQDLGAVAEKYTVSMGGCAHCPIRCHSQVRIPQLEERYGIDPNVSNTCVGYSGPNGIMFKGTPDLPGQEKGEQSMISKTLGSHLADDYGVWCNYGQMGRDLNWTYTHGILKKVLPADEYASISWDLLEKGDPAFLIDFYDRVANKKGELWHIADGSYWIDKRWNLGEEYWAYDKNKLWSKLGYPVHHANESQSQVGALVSCFSNRDAQNHSHSNFGAAGVPLELLKQVAAEEFGTPDAIDGPMDYTPMNQGKANFVKWALTRTMLHNSLTLCNWMWPMAFSPLKSRNYRGDTALEAKFYSLVTGIPMTKEDLDRAATRTFTLFRALTIRSMGTADMRNKHDQTTSWVITATKDKNGKEIPQFTKGTDRMTQEDMEKGRGLVYKAFGWDEKTGAPTKATLEALGMPEVAAELAAKGLLPA
ncbi:MAG: aldehyde ferredoxin oxidoreductase [Spirochaetes bacterium RIFOXYC1_FULL_54_7]|nr:MAG: aldehyde ferredoxin oxidoreductase [Spirochaetes bacterium RIFOXYC1_FULL_54_7]